LAACLESFCAAEEIHDFYSSAINGKTTAIKTTRLATFPDYLVIHLRKFILDAGWVPKKLDVFVDVPDELDISSMRGQGLQPDEQLLPETAGVFLLSLNLLLNCGQLPELHMALAPEVT
jgi:ubiquitin carboxyl-terminal hydrolase 5/13